MSKARIENAEYCAVLCILYFKYILLKCILGSISSTFFKSILYFVFKYF